ncbi:MAG: SufD family Fe-S cluster assembly protein [Candidatus Micrarchaeia archaeon]
MPQISELIEETNRMQKELYSKYSFRVSLKQFKEAMDDNAATIENIQQTFPIKPNYVVRNAEKSASEDTSKDFESLEEIERYIEQQGKQIEIKGKESSGFTLIISPGVFLPLKISVEIPDYSEANIFELFTGPASTIALQRIDLGKESKAEINILQAQGPKSKLALTNTGIVSENSELAINSLFAGGSFTKADNLFEAIGKGGVLKASTVIAGNSNQAFDISNTLINSAPETVVSSKSATVVEDSAVCFMKDFAKVAKEASGSVSHVEERGIIADSARFVPLPDMSVDTRQVKDASHSASSEPLNAKDIFYMSARGVPLEKAKSMLMLGLPIRYLNDIKSAKIKEVMISLLKSKILYNSVRPEKIDTFGIWTA